MYRNLRRGGLVAATALALATALVQAAPAWASTAPAASRGHTSKVPQCGFNGHYYGSADSGYSSYGTEAHIWTWTHWSVSHVTGHFSGESAWISDPNNGHYSMEVGFVSGQAYSSISGGYNGWTNGMMPYYTVGDSTQSYFQDVFLPASTYIYLIAQAAGSDDFADVLGSSTTYMAKDITNWPISSDRAHEQNHMQGEVTDTGTWMGGGSGDSMTMYWINSGGSAYPWGYLNMCENSPYWASSSNGTDYFANGGY